MSQTFHDHFSSLAKNYADFRPNYPDDLFDFLATAVPRRQLAWDCACGTGQATHALAERFDRVIATDASPQQIQSAQLNPKIEYRVAPAEASGLASESVDLVTVAQAMHWFDLSPFFAEVNRVLQPDGLLAVWTYGACETDADAINQLIRDYHYNRIGPYWPPERQYVENKYATLPFPFQRLPAPAFTMRQRWTLDQLIGYFSSWSGTKNYIASRGHNPLDPLRAELAAVWPEPDAPREIRWPIALHLGARQK